jgi:putative ABC transport system permease protein
MVPAIRAAAVAEAPDVPLVSVQTLETIESTQRTSLTRAMTGVGGAGAVALFLTAIGLYAVVAFAVCQRVREIGIRTALGANRQQVVRWFLMRGLTLSLGGMLVGLALSVIAVQLMAALRGSEAPSGIAGLAALVAGAAITVALVASWIPARRAAVIDPLLAVRTER